MRYLTFALFLLAATAQADIVNIVVEGTFEQKGGTGVDPLDLDGSSIRIVASYDDSVPYYDVYYFTMGGAAYGFSSAVQSIEFGFYNRPNDAPPVVQSYQLGGGGELSLSGPTAITSYDDFDGPGRISIGTTNGNFNGTGPHASFQAVQIQGLWSQPFLPSLAQWSTWSAGYYGQNDPFSNLASISSSGPPSFSYGFVYANPITVNIYDEAEMPPFPGDVIPVVIDVLPGDPANVVYPNLAGKVPVAVLGSAEFDATQIDPATVAFGPAGAAPADPPLVGQVDGLHGDDMTLRFQMQATGILCNDTDVTLSGQTYAGDPFEGTDSIDATECESGGCHAY